MRHLTLSLLLLSLGGCYLAPGLDSPYRCETTEQCGGDSLLCDDGVCCRTDAEPYCPTFVAEGGTCPSGAPPIEFYRDLDGDSWGNGSEPLLLCAKPVLDTSVTDRSGDCADENASVHPGLAEICNGIDDDCSGEIDDLDPSLLPVWFRDADADGYGNPDDSVSTCFRPDGYVENSSDCDDAVATAFPGGTEVCNGVDDNCDGTIDEDVKSTFYPDSDGDTFGVSAGAMQACTKPSGFATNANDCNDGSASINPGAAETCGDGVDNNCDGLPDNRLDCDGPIHFLTAADAAFGAKKLDRYTNGTTTGMSCWHEEAGTNQTFNKNASPHWRANQGGSQLAWVRRTGGRWDLDATGRALRLRMSVSLTNGNATPWSAFNQPAILICGQTGFYRLRPNPDTLLTMSGASAINQLIPLQGGNGWITAGLTSKSATATTIPDVLNDVLYIEVLMQPNDSDTAQLEVAFHANWGIE